MEEEVPSIVAEYEPEEVATEKLEKIKKAFATGWEKPSGKLIEPVWEIEIVPGFTEWGEPMTVARLFYGKRGERKKMDIECDEVRLRMGFSKVLFWGPKTSHLWISSGYPTKCVVADKMLVCDYQWE